MPLGGQDNSGATWFGSMFGFDPEFDPTTVTLAPTSSLGTVNWVPYGGGPTPAGWFYTFTPNSGATGTDTFTLTTTDCFGKAGTTTVFVKITNAPHIWWLAPVANADQADWGDRWEEHLIGSGLAHVLRARNVARIVTREERSSC